MTLANYADGDPQQLALMILKTQTSRRYELRFWRQSWYRWTGKRFLPLSDDAVRAAVFSGIDGHFTALNQQSLEKIDPNKSAPTKLKTKRSLVGDVVDALKSILFINEHYPVPRWMDGDLVGVPPKHFIAVNNGIIDARTIVDGVPGPLLEHSPDWFSMTYSPAVHDPDARCPRWDAFLEKNLRGDHELCQMLCEWFGYCLTPDTSQQRFLMIEGEGKNGKSVVCAVLRALLGGENVSHVGLEEFGERFALNQTVGKLANIASEIGELDRVAEGKLKAFTSGDRMTIDRKNKDPIELIPTARLVLATNNRPRFADKSSGLWRRMLLLPMTYQVPEDERIFGMDSVEFWADELPGILNWALAGLSDLRRYGRFTEPEAMKQAMADYRSESNPCRLFLLERCTYTGAAHEWVRAATLYQSYRKWCEAGGYQPINDQNFGREIFRLWPSVRKSNRGSDGERFRAYDGLKFISDHEVTFDMSGFN